MESEKAVGVAPGCSRRGAGGPAAAPRPPLRFRFVLTMQLLQAPLSRSRHVSRALHVPGARPAPSPQPGGVAGPWPASDPPGQGGGKKRVSAESHPTVRP